VALDQANRKDPRCSRTVTIGKLTAHGKAGRNTLVFKGTWRGVRKLAAGSYTVSFAAAGAAKGTRAVVLSFTVVK
jgi:hypothetical protein